MPPASFVRPGISSGDVWTLSIATEKLISTPLLRLSLIADAWPAPFVCFLLTYEHLFTPLFFLVYYQLEQNTMTFLFHDWFFFSHLRNSLTASYISLTSTPCCASSCRQSLRRLRAAENSADGIAVHRARSSRMD